MLTWLWLLFLAAGVATIIVGARRATDADGRIPRGSEPWRAVFTGLGLFAIGQVFLIVDGAMHGHVGRSVSGAVALGAMGVSLSDMEFPSGGSGRAARMRSERST